MQRELSHITITAVDSRGLGRGVVELPDGTTRPLVVPGTMAGDVVDVMVRRRRGGRGMARSCG